MTTNPGRGFGWLVRRPSVAQEVDDELAFHVDMVMSGLIAGGMTADDARAEAVRRFGDIAVTRAECQRFGRQRDRLRSRAEYVAELKQDCGFALRQLRRARGFTATATITLALGIGATAAVFSALDAVVLQPLPYADPDRVVHVLPIRRGTTVEIVSGAELAAVREARNAFSAVAGTMMGGEHTISEFGPPESVPASQVTAEYFHVLGVAPVLGRGFLPADDVPGAPAVVLMSHRLWTRRFRSDTSVIGRRIRLGEDPHTVIGVLPASFDERGGPDDLWTPLQLTTAQLTGSGGQWLHIVARLAPGTSIAQATDAARRAFRGVAERTPDAAKDVSAVVRRAVDDSVGALRGQLFVLFGAVGFVLLIACVNVANLLLARGTVRVRELAIRAALGAGRGRLARQLLAECLMLAAIGGAAGVVVAYALVHGLAALGPDGAPRLRQAHLSLAVLAFTFGVAVVSSLLAGLVPSMRVASVALETALRAGGRGASAGARSDRLRATLVAAEIALAVTLVVGSGLLIRTAWRLQHEDPGFEPTHVMTTRLALPLARYRDPALIERTYERMLEATRQSAGVERAALVSVVPMSASSMRTRVSPEGRALAPDERVAVDIRYASPDYFVAMKIAMRTGRDFALTDDAGTPPVAVISERLARTLWPGASPIGKRIDAMGVTRGQPNWMTVVGVVGDVHDVAMNAPAEPTLYMPVAQTPAGMWNAMQRSLVLVALARGAPETIVSALQAAVRSVDPALPLLDAQSMQHWIATTEAAARFNTLLLTVVSGLALVLAGVGVFGVVTYFVSQRTREIGVRIALGARPSDIWRLVARRGFVPVAWGAALGIALSIWTAGLLRDQLFGVGPNDPTTLIAVVATMVAVGAVATLGPARRAMRVAPTRALMSE